MTLKPVIPIFASAVVVSMFGIWFWQRRKGRKTYVKVGKVKKLYFFPVKSLKGIEVDELECTSVGVKYKGFIDRSIMLVDNKGVLISQREEPSLSLLTTSIADSEITVSSGTGEPLKITLKDGLGPGEQVIDCQIHSDVIKGVDYGNEAATWFQKYLKRSDVRVVRPATDVSHREYTGNHPLVSKFKREHPVYFQDCGAVHLVSESSLTELNTRVESKVSVFNFRPNILVGETSPYDEDNWKCLKFSSGAELVTLIPCGRCVLTTVDPETGIKGGKEPLQSLRKFRMLKDKNLSRAMNYSPTFGLYMTAEKAGYIQVNDDMFAVVEKGLFQCTADA